MDKWGRCLENQILENQASDSLLKVKLSVRECRGIRQMVDDKTEVQTCEARSRRVTPPHALQLWVVALGESHVDL